MVSIPVFAKDFSVDWLNEVLAPHLGNNLVVSCSARDSDIPGQTAAIVLIDVEYRDAAPTLPGQMVAKITSRDPVVLEQVIANYDQYRRETSFYREFPDCGIPAPRCLYSDHKPETQEMVILMADLAPSISPSWAASTEQVRMALSKLPGLHSKWWNDELLRSKDWMVQFDNRAFFGAVYNAAHRGKDALDHHFDTPELTQSIMAFLAENLDLMLKFTASRPFTFVHGDYHAKQMFFPSSEGGEFAVIDWQFPFVAQGAWDFARMISMCLPADVRRAQERNFLNDYHAGLMDMGVPNYPMHELEIDYRMGLIISQAIMVVAASDTDPAILEKECDDLGLDWKEVMFNRTQYALDEWNALGFLKGLR